VLISGQADRFDPSRAHPARVYDCLCGGKDHFAADRQAADQVRRAAPWAVEGARANRAFLTRAVTHLARTGLRQFLDIGSGLPTAGNVHQIAQRITPDARVVYVDCDPFVLAHSRALLAGRNTIAVAGDARDPQAILTDPDVRAHLDLDQPVAVLFVALLHFLLPEDDPGGVVATVREALAPGSHLVISHAADLPDAQQPPGRAEATRAAAEVYQQLTAPLTVRTPCEIQALFAGFDLIDPGLVCVNQWRPTRSRPSRPVPVLGGVARLGARPTRAPSR
jgi:SAM-dependent methyltransferase